jgi:GAF domain-containing protein
MERAELVARALVFLVRLTDADVPLDEALNALSALAEQFQSGAIVGGTLIDSSSATFERVVYPSLLASPFSTLRHIPISSPTFGTCAKAVREGKTISCSDTATDACFDVGWRSLYLGLGIHSVQSAPVFSFNGRPLGTFVVALRQPHASFDMEMTGLGVYAMRTILQKPPHYRSGSPPHNLNVL